MKIWLIVLGMLFAVSVYAQEPPATVPATYQIQIRNYYQTDWQDITPVKIEIVDGVVGKPDYYNGYGLQRFEVEALDSTREKPRKVVIDIEIKSPGTFFSFQVFVARIKAMVVVDGKVELDGPWSEPSHWVCLINLPMMRPGIWVQ